MNNIIYALVDPSTQGIRYIGMSTVGLIRAKSHLYPSNYNTRKQRVYSWIKYCFKNGIKPEIVILEEFADIKLIDLYAEEQFYISYLKSLGCNLTNSQDGGPGYGKKGQIPWNLGKKHSQESINKMKITCSKRTMTQEKLNQLGNARVNIISRGYEKKKVIDQFGNIYSSVLEAAKTIGTSSSNISAVCKKKLGKKSLKGFVFNYI